MATARPLLACIDRRSTEQGNVEVLNDTAHAEFLYRCIAQTVDADLPNKTAYLEAFARFSKQVQNVIDMSESSVDLLHHFLQSGNDRLSKRAREREFAALTDDEAEALETAYERDRQAWSSR
jgi:hypothetical protein